VAAAKEEFMKEFERAVSGLLVELAPSPVKAQVSNTFSPHLVSTPFLVSVSPFIFL
jgi:hypothetical protein